MPPLLAPGATVTEVLDRVLQDDPGRQAVSDRQQLTYGQLDAAADAGAAALHTLGIRPGDRIVVSLPNEIPIVVAFHAAMRLGAVWVGINGALAPPRRTPSCRSWSRR